MIDMKTFYEQTVNTMNKNREVPPVVPAVSETGVIFGRFQPLHLGHAEYMLGAKMRCKKLFIGIDAPDDSYLWRYKKPDDKAETIYLTYFERQEMVRLVMKEFGVPEEEYEIVPFPAADRKALFGYVPYDAVFYATSFDGNEGDRVRLLREYGCRVYVLTNKQAGDVTASTAAVQEILAEGGDYRLLVPKSVYEYMTEHRLGERFRAETPESL